MTKNNTKSGDDIFGFFGALFGACMGEDRKESKKEIKKASSFSDVVTNLSKAMIPNEKEVKEFGEDVKQFKESRMYADPEKGLASQISRASEDISGQRPPGFLEKLLGYLTDPASPYARPLDEKNRSITINNLRQFSESSFGENSSGKNNLSLQAKEIATNLGLRDSDDGPYKFASLAGAANEAGLTRENLIKLTKGLEEQTPEKNPTQSSQTPKDNTRTPGDNAQTPRDNTRTPGNGTTNFGSFGGQSSRISRDPLTPTRTTSNIGQTPGLASIVGSLRGNSSPSPSRGNSFSPSRSNSPSPPRDDVRPTRESPFTLKQSNVEKFRGAKPGITTGGGGGGGR
jgi:hypothetical protein